MMTGALTIGLLYLAASGAATPSTKALLLLDSRRLADAAARMRGGDSLLVSALAELEGDARAALRMPPVSVMDKAVTPPSGDKHDYMSQGPYWWADPSKPDGVPYIRRDGVRNPEIDKITDHGHFDRLMRAVATLGLAFHLTHREEYATHATRLLRTWFLDPATRMNPHLQFGQGIPGITEGRGIGIIETRSLPELLDGVILLDGSRAWTDTDEAGLQKWMRDYLAWLTDSQHGRDESKNGNNHETWYDVQVAALALYTGRKDLARSTLRRSRERIATQIEPDGRQPKELERTRSWHYSIFNLTAFFHLAALGGRLDVDIWAYRTTDGRGLRRALDFLAPFATGAQRWTYEEISGFEASALHWLLRRAAVAWGEPKYRSLARQVGGGRPEMDLVVP
jgi:hypothetical protein